MKNRITLKQVDLGGLIPLGVMAALMVLSVI